MLAEGGVSHLREWLALGQIEREERLQEEAANRAETNLGAGRGRR